MASNGRKRNPAGAIVALLILIMIVIALVVVIRQGGGEAEETPTPPAQESTEPAPTPTPTPEATPTPAPEPTPTPEPTPSPTPSPEPSAEPTPELARSGSFRSDTGTGLEIVVDWSLSGSGAETRLSLTLSAESYSLQTREIWKGAALTLGGETFEFDTEAVDFAGPGQGTSVLGTLEAVIDGSILPAQAELSWHFQGSYGGEELEYITASGTIG